MALISIHALRTTACAAAIVACAQFSQFSTVQAQEPQVSIEQLQRQIESQAKRIDELAAEIAENQGAIRRLPAVDDVEDNANASAVRDEAIDVRLDRLEGSLLELEDETQGFLDGIATKSQRIVNGRIHIDQWGFPKSSPGINTIESGNPAGDPQDRLLYRRIRIGIRGTVPPANMSYRAELEFSGQDSTFRDVWLGWDDLAWFDTVRIGNQKRPYGLDHLNNSNYMVFIERPLVVDALNEDNRRFGLASYGVSDDKRYNWRYGIYNMHLIQDTGETFGDTYPMELAGRLASTCWYDEMSAGRGYAHLAISGTLAFPNGNPPAPGDQDDRARFRTFPEGRSANRWLDTDPITGSNSYQLLGVESVINVGSFQVGGEYMNVWLQREPAVGRNVFFHGGYVYVSYFLTGEHLPWNRQLGVLGRLEPLENFFHINTCKGCVEHGRGAWQLAGRFSYADFNDADIFGGYGRSATIAVNWYWNAHARLQFNYIFGHIENRQAALAAGGTAIVSGGYQISGVRFMIDF